MSLLPLAPFCAGALVACSCSRPAPSTKDAPPGAPSAVIQPASTGTAPGPPLVKAPSVPDDCEHLFSPPAGAELLCDQHDLGTDAEVHWKSYAIAEHRVDVNRRYQERAGRCGAGFVTKPPIFSVSQGSTRLSTHEAAPIDYPTCGKAPSPAHRTVILISTMLKR